MIIGKPEKVLSEQSIEELLSLIGDIPSNPAKTRGPNKGGRVTDRVDIHHTWFSDICNELESWVEDGTKVCQFDLLIYNKGGFFGPHRDLLDRVWSTSTVLQESDDLFGGDLIFMDNWKAPSPSSKIIDIPVGETVIFDSQEQYHQVTEVVKGSRIVLVSWLK